MREERTPVLGREVGKPLRKEEYPSREEIASLTGEVGKSRIKEAIGLALVSSGLVGLTVGCARELIEPTPTVEPTEETGIPSPTLEIKTPTPISSPPPEIVPSPTVTVEAIGFGMEDLTPAEQKLVTDLETAYRTAADNQGMREGTIILTHGDEEGEVGAYFEDKEGDFWSLVAREEKKILEKVPSFREASPSWNPDEVRFEYKIGEESFVWQPEESMVVDLNERPVALWEASSWWQPAFLEEFDSNVNAWLTQGERAFIREGKYYLSFSSDHEVWSSKLLGLNDFTLEVEIGPGKNTHAYGLVFGNENEARYYIFNLHGGDFSFQKVDRGEWEDLAWKTSGAIRGGEALNSLKVIRQEGKFILFINGQEIGTFPDELGVASEIGIYAGGGDKIVVENLKAWASQDWVEPVPTPIPPTPEVTPVPTPTEVPAEACPPGSEAIPPEIGRYQHGGPTELFHANAERFDPDSRRFLGGREEIFFGVGRITQIDLSSEAITVETLSGTFTFRFSSQTLFALFDTNTWGYVNTDRCKFQKGDIARIHVEAPGDGAFLTGIWQ